MLMFYYTVSSAPMVGSQTPNSSLGGYQSSTQVSNDSLDNLFTDISMNMMRNGRSQYRGIVLVNEGTEELSNVNLWFANPQIMPLSGSEDTGMQGRFRLGAVQMSKDTTGNWHTESIPNENSRPYSATFYEATGEENKVGIGSMAPDEHVCLWIERYIDKGQAKADYEEIAERDPANPIRYRPIEKDDEEAISLTVSWD